MCASYGLGGGRRDGESPDTSRGAAHPDLPHLDLPPLDTRESRELLTEWWRRWGGKANITRTQQRGTNLNPVITADETGERRLELAWWWLHVGGAPARFTAFNSRDDALVTKWRGPFQYRALLPADWYSEGGKRWSLPDGELFAIAAILAPRATDGALSYSMVTRSGVGEAANVVTSRGDSRMPLVLPRELHDEWLDPARPGDPELVARVQLASDEISRSLTTVRFVANDGAGDGVQADPPTLF